MHCTQHSHVSELKPRHPSQNLLWDPSQNLLWGPSHNLPWDPSQNLPWDHSQNLLWGPSQLPAEWEHPQTPAAELCSTKPRPKAA